MKRAESYFSSWDLILLFLIHKVQLKCFLSAGEILRSETSWEIDSALTQWN